MSPFSISLARPEDFPELLALQDLNHVSTLPAETLASGFVTTTLTSEYLLRMSANKGVWVVRGADGTLAGYACANGWAFYGTNRFQEAALKLLPVDGVRADNSFQYGPVCVAQEYRGQGVLKALVESVKAHYAGQFEFGITFIDTRNERSLAAHERKLGFRRVGLLHWDVDYLMLAFGVRE